MWKTTTVFIVIAFLTWLLTLLASNHPKLVEKYYSNTAYPFIVKVIGLTSSLVSMSLAEIIVIIAFLFLSILVVLLLLQPSIFVHNKNRLKHYIIRAVAILYILFYFLWGFNYYRQDYMELAGMNPESSTLEDLVGLTQETIDNLNRIRQNLSQDNEGVFIIHNSFQEISEQAQIGFHDFTIQSLNGYQHYNLAKPVFLSKWMSHTGIMGIYFPYTSEPNVNTDIPDQSLMSTICHEMAHQRGFAKEEEANFIAYKASIHNSNKEFQYSGYYLAMQYLMSELYKQDPEAYQLMYSKISDAVKRDMYDSRKYWLSKEGKAEKVVTKINDTYLKANNQEKGIQSYNGVVTLLLSEYKR